MLCYSYNFVSTRKSDKIAKNFFGADLPDLEDLAYQTNLFLVNSHFSLNQARPTVPNFIEVGGLHIKQPKPLPEVCFFRHNLSHRIIMSILFAASRKYSSKQQQRYNIS